MKANRMIAKADKKVSPLTTIFEQYTTCFRDGWSLDGQVVHSV